MMRFQKSLNTGNQTTVICWRDNTCAISWCHSTSLSELICTLKSSCFYYIASLTPSMWCYRCWANLIDKNMHLAFKRSWTKCPAHTRLNKRQGRWTLNSTDQRILKRNNIPLFFETNYKQTLWPKIFWFSFCFNLQSRKLGQEILT